MHHQLKNIKYKNDQACKLKGNLLHIDGKTWVGKTDNQVCTIKQMPTIKDSKRENSGDSFVGPKKDPSANKRKIKLQNFNKSAMKIRPKEELNTSYNNLNTSIISKNKKNCKSFIYIYIFSR